MDLDLNCKKAEIRPSSRYEFNVVLDDVDENDIINLFSVRDFIDKKGVNEIMDYIDDDDLIAYIRLRGYEVNEIA